MRSHPWASLVFLLTSVVCIGLFFAWWLTWAAFYKPRIWLDPTPMLVPAVVCGIPAVLCWFISMGLGLHAAFTHRWVLIWVLPLIVAALGSLAFEIIDFMFGPNRLWNQRLPRMIPGLVAIVLVTLVLYGRRRRKWRGNLLPHQR